MNHHTVLFSSYISNEYRSMADGQQITMKWTKIRYIWSFDFVENVGFMRFWTWIESVVLAIFMSKINSFCGVLANLPRWFVYRSRTSTKRAGFTRFHQNLLMCFPNVNSSSCGKLAKTTKPQSWQAKVFRQLSKVTSVGNGNDWMH